MDPRPRRGLVSAMKVLRRAALLPGVVFLGVILVWPMADLVWRSFTEPGLSNYTQLADRFYLETLWRTLVVAFMVTAVCAVVAYPYAYMMRLSSRRARAILVALILLPFWTSWLVRTFAWSVILQDRGVINSTLMDLGLIDAPLPLIRTSLGVAIGMTHIMLPFMVLPAFAGMVRIDLDQIAAARSLGATRTRAFWTVFFPASLPGLMAGCVTVFVVSAGFYVVPAQLGGADKLMFAQLIEQYVAGYLEFGAGSAMAMVLFAATLSVVIVASRFPSVRSSLSRLDRNGDV